jgi:sulfur carrier protein
MTEQADAETGLLTLVVNGERRPSSARTLAQLLDELGYGGQKVATALNGEFVAARSRADRVLKAGDEIEVVAPRQGG